MSDSGRMVRPETSVLPEKVVVPPENLVRPAPNHFTHLLTADEPYRFEHRDDGVSAGPNGVLGAGERVLLAVEGAERSRVITGDGLYVDVRTRSLRALPG